MGRAGQRAGYLAAAMYGVTNALSRRRVVRTDAADQKGDYLSGRKYASSLTQKDR